MSPKSFILLLVVGLCATQLVSGHREARSVNDLLNKAKTKLQSLIGNVKDAAGSSVEVVYKHMEKLENMALDAGSKRLQAAGIDLDLHALADLLKEDVKMCGQEHNLKAEAKAILNNVGSCVNNDISAMNQLINNMKSLWKTAKTLPDIMSKVSKQCGIHADDSALTAITAQADLPEVDDEEDVDDDLSNEADQIVEDASHRVSKRAAWNLKRITRCVKAVYALAKNELVNIPGEIVATAGNAFNLVKSAQSGVTACVSKKLSESAATIGQLASKVGSCVTTRVSEGEAFDKIIEQNTSLKAIKQLATVAKQFQGVSGSSALSAMGTVAKLVG